MEPHPPPKGGPTHSPTICNYLGGKKSNPSFLLFIHNKWVTPGHMVYFSILCVLRCSGHMCYSHQFTNNLGRQELGVAGGRWMGAEPSRVALRTYERTYGTARDLQKHQYNCLFTDTLYKTCLIGVFRSQDAHSVPFSWLTFLLVV